MQKLHKSCSQFHFCLTLACFFFLALKSLGMQMKISKQFEQRFTLHLFENALCLQLRKFSRNLHLQTEFNVKFQSVPSILLPLEQLAPDIMLPSMFEGTKGEQSAVQCGSWDRELAFLQSRESWHKQFETQQAYRMRDKELNYRFPDFFTCKRCII